MGRWNAGLGTRFPALVNNTMKLESKVTPRAECKAWGDAKPSVGHGADFFFDFGDVHHDNGVPRAAVQEAAIGAFAKALLAADTEDGIDLDAAKGRMVFVRDPEHAVFNRTVLDARGRASAAGATLGDDGEFFGFLFAGSGDALRAGLVFQLVGNHAGSFDFRLRGHDTNYTWIL